MKEKCQWLIRHLTMLQPVCSPLKRPFRAGMSYILLILNNFPILNTLCQSYLLHLLIELIETFCAALSFLRTLSGYFLILLASHFISLPRGRVRHIIRESALSAYHSLRHLHIKRRLSRQSEGKKRKKKNSPQENNPVVLKQPSSDR